MAVNRRRQEKDIAWMKENEDEIYELEKVKYEGTKYDPDISDEEREILIEEEERFKLTPEYYMENPLEAEMGMYMDNHHSEVPSEETIKILESLVMTNETPDDIQEKKLTEAEIKAQTDAELRAIIAAELGNCSGGS
jgi:hypothetical protein